MGKHIQLMWRTLKLSILLLLFLSGCWVQNDWGQIAIVSARLESDLVRLNQAQESSLYVLLVQEFKKYPNIRSLETVLGTNEYKQLPSRGDSLPPFKNINLENPAVFSLLTEALQVDTLAIITISISEKEHRRAQAVFVLKEQGRDPVQISLPPVYDDPSAPILTTITQSLKSFGALQK